MREAGFTNIRSMGIAFNYSTGTAAHESWCQNFLTALRLMRPFMTEMVKVVTPERFDDLVAQAQLEMLSENFNGISYGLIAWGIKPD
jgi:hypothetical protein